MPTPYLFRLGERLAAGVEKLPADFRTRHRDFILSLQAEDGGWAGRDGDPDLYYTGFAVRSLSMLGGLDGPPGERAADFLKRNASGLNNIVDLLSWLYSALAVPMAGGPLVLEDTSDAWTGAVAGWLEAFRHTDGGYAKTIGGSAGSTYHTFLAALCVEMLGRPIPEADRLLNFLANHRREDGGFVEIPQMKLSGSNPTAAGLACWSMLETPPQDLLDDTADYFRSVKSDEGGFQANARIPFADGLSTFTVWLSVVDFDLQDVSGADVVRQYIMALENPSGGFFGASWDAKADVEYTFYGLGTAALTA